MLQPDKSHIEFQIPPLAHTSMYNWHKYWARKTWNVVGEWIETYCPEGGIVVDPFMGSGVSVIEAVRRGRRAIGIDLNPVAVEIVELTLRDVDLVALKEAFSRVEKAVAKKIEDLYKTECRKCHQEVDAACFIWNDDKPELVRYECTCGKREEHGAKLNPDDKALIKQAEDALAASKLWYPQDRLYYPDDSPFKEKQKYNSIPELFTQRNLYALALLMRQIEKEANPLLRRFLKITFSSMVHNCSKMMPVGNPADTNHYTFFSSPGWTQHSYWHTPRFMEQPVWRKFESAFSGHQGILNAKTESQETFKKPVKFARNIDQFLEGKADVLLVAGSAQDTLRQWREKKYHSSFADFCFTDPPYAGSIQYGELSFMWVRWLGIDGDYLSDLIQMEVVENARQKKNFERYEQMLAATLGEINSALKPDAHMVLTFHNPTFRVRNATIRAATRKKFDFEKIHHQPTAVVSAKSLLQPFGSATGDFYLRFLKPRSIHVDTLQPWDEARFERAVMDGVYHLLAERWEPTPYTIIINFIDPLLAREGFFRELYSGFDVNTVLKAREGDDLVIEEVKIGNVSGKAWWFKYPERIKQRGVPLTERVEASVIRELLSKNRVTFTDIWRRIGEEFPNSLTPDALSIRDVLKDYAKEAKGGMWQILPRFRERIGQHKLLITTLAQIGSALGYQIWIGRNEQSKAGPHKESLQSHVTAEPSIFAGSGTEADRSILDMDLLWIKGRKIITAFEIEFSTTITSAIERGSHLPDSADRFIVLPEERIPKLKRKMESSFFRRGFEEFGWHVLVFDSVLDNQKQLATGKITLSSLVWDSISSPTGRNTGQLALQPPE